MNWWYITGLIVVLVGFGAFFGAPYVPSKRRDVRKVFTDFRPLSADDVVVDAGCGDGLVLNIVAGHGARAVGIEINPLFYIISRLVTRGQPRIKVRLGNFWWRPLPADTTLVYIFSVSRDGRKLIRKLQAEADRLRRPLELLCYGSPLPDVEPAGTFEAYSQYRFVPLH